MKTAARILFIVLTLATLGLSISADALAAEVSILKIELPAKYPGGASAPASATVVLADYAPAQVTVRVSVDPNYSDLASAHAVGNQSLRDITIPINQNRGSFQITCPKGVATDTAVPIKAQVVKIGGNNVSNGSSLTTNLTLRRAMLSSVTLSPTSIGINSTGKGTIKLDGKTPPDVSFPFTITSSNPGAARPTVPAIVLPTNSRSVEFEFKSGVVLVDTVVKFTIYSNLDPNQREEKYLTVKLIK
jgi:hypothetical protein